MLRIYFKKLLENLPTVIFKQNMKFNNISKKRERERMRVYPFSNADPKLNFILDTLQFIFRLR